MNEEPQPKNPGPTTRFAIAASAILKRTVNRDAPITDTIPASNDTAPLPNEDPKTNTPDHTVMSSGTEAPVPSITPRAGDIAISPSALKGQAEYYLGHTKEGKQIRHHRGTNTMVIKFFSGEPPTSQEDSDRVHDALVRVYKFDPTDPDYDEKSTYARASRAQAKLVELTNQLANENPYGIHIGRTFDSGAPPINGIEQKVTVTGINLRGELDLATTGAAGDTKPMPPQSFRSVSAAIALGTRQPGNHPT